MIFVLVAAVLAIHQVYEYTNSSSGDSWVSQVNAQTENATFTLWRINAAVPGDQLRLSISDNVHKYQYDIMDVHDVLSMTIVASFALTRFGDPNGLVGLTSNPPPVAILSWSQNATDH